jgi:hypothetical protein
MFLSHASAARLRVWQTAGQKSATDGDGLAQQANRLEQSVSNRVPIRDRGRAAEIAAAAAVR